MLVKFNQAVHLKGKTVKGKDYSRGVHEVHEEHLADPHFHKLVKAGLVEDGEAAKVVAPASLQERQRMLADKLAKPAPSAKVPSQGQSAQKPAVAAGASQAPVAPPVADVPAPAVDLVDPAEKLKADQEKADAEELAKMEAEEAAEKAKAKQKHKGK